MKAKLKTTVLFLLFVTVSNLSYSQSGRTHSILPSYIRKFTNVGDLSFIITYDVTIFRYPKDYVFPSSLTNYKKAKAAKPTSVYYLKDIQVLEIGDGISKTYSKLLYEVDSTVNTFGRRSYPMALSRSSKKTLPIEVYKNYPQGKYTVTQRAFKDVLMYEEPYPIDFKWQLTDDKKTIHSYECQKATTTFRGRTFEAWFAVDIPISDGPYKFGGLPGLILELRDSENDYVYNCIGIKECKTILPIKFWDWKYKKMTKEKHDKFVKDIHKNTGLYLKAQAQAQGNGKGPKYVNMNTGEESYADFSKISHPYNPIELE